MSVEHPAEFRDPRTPSISALRRDLLDAGQINSQVLWIVPRSIDSYRCLIISPSDVEAERNAVEAAISSWNAHAGHQQGIVLEAVRWESHGRPELGKPPQAIINKQLVESCDFGVAIFWSRVGSPTSAHASGSVEEIELLRDRGAEVMVYFCSRDVPQARLQDDQFARLQQIKSHYEQHGLLATFSSVEQLHGQVALHLSNLVSALSKGASERVTEPLLAGNDNVGDHLRLIKREAERMVRHATDLNNLMYNRSLHPDERASRIHGLLHVRFRAGTLELSLVKVMSEVDKDQILREQLDELRNLAWAADSEAERLQHHWDDDRPLHKLVNRMLTPGRLVADAAAKRIAQLQE